MRYDDGPALSRERTEEPFAAILFAKLAIIVNGCSRRRDGFAFAILRRSEAFRRGRRRAVRGGAIVVKRRVGTGIDSPGRASRRRRRERC